MFIGLRRYDVRSCRVQWRGVRKCSSRVRDAKFGSDDRDDCRPFGLDAFIWLEVGYVASTPVRGYSISRDTFIEGFGEIPSRRPQMVRFRDDVGVGCGRRADGRNEIGLSPHQERARKMNGWTVDVKPWSAPTSGLGSMDLFPFRVVSCAEAALATPVRSHRGTKNGTVLHERKGSPRRLAVTAVPLNHRSKA